MSTEDAFEARLAARRAARAIKSTVNESPTAKADARTIIATNTARSIASASPTVARPQQLAAEIVGGGLDAPLAKASQPRREQRPTSPSVAKAREFAARMEAESAAEAGAASEQAQEAQEQEAHAQLLRRLKLASSSARSQSEASGSPRSPTPVSPGPLSLSSSSRLISAEDASRLIDEEAAAFHPRPARNFISSHSTSHERIAQPIEADLVRSCRADLSLLFSRMCR